MIRPENVPDTEWAHEILEHPAWPKMEEFIFGEMHGWMTGGLTLAVSRGCSLPVQKALKRCGLDEPQTQEEELRTYLALRSVVAYLTDKKMRLSVLKNAHQEKMRKAMREPQTTLQQGR